MDRLVEGRGIELTPGYVDEAADRLAKRGCQLLIDMLARPSL